MVDVEGSPPGKVDTVHSYCRYCMAACGVTITVDREANRVLRIAPDKKNPYSWQDFCPSGRTANELAEHPRRVLTPMRRVGDSYVEATYEEALADISTRLNQIIDRYGPDAVGSYHGNPAAYHLGNTVFYGGLLEAIGTGNRYWVASVDQNNQHVVSEKLYGSPLVSLQTDIDECDYFLLIGANPAVSAMSWTHNSPNGWRRVLERKRDGAQVVIVDPTRTESARDASLHVAVRPGQDWAFLLGLIKVIMDSGLDRPSTTLPVVGHDGIRRLVSQCSLTDLSERCDVSEDTIRDVAVGFATAKTSLCSTQTGVAQSLNGTVGAWLSHVLNLICDRIDTPGGRRFERGYTDMIRTAAMMLPESKHKSRVAGRETVAGFHSLAEMADEILTPGPGQIRAAIINSGNPVVSGPNGARLDEALEGLDLLVSIDLVQRESHRHADWLIPGSHWLERGELHYLQGGLQERPFAQYARGAVTMPEGVMNEWEFFMDLALAMGRPLFGKRGVNTFVKATKALATITGRPGLAFSNDWVESIMVASGRRVRMKDVKARPHGYLYAEKEYGMLRNSLRTPDGNVRLDLPEFVDEANRLLATALAAADPAHPFVLSNRRHREDMNSFLIELPGLHKRSRTNVLDIHPDDASEVGVADGDIASVSNDHGRIELEVRVTDEVRRGVVRTQHGWGSGVFDPTGEEPEVRHGANRNLLTGAGHVDVLSHTPGFNDTCVAVAPAAAP